MKHIETFNEKMLNESKREKVFLNGWEYWIDREKMMLYDKEESKQGISLFSSHLTDNEKKQLRYYLRFGR